MPSAKQKPSTAKRPRARKLARKGPKEWAAIDFVEPIFDLVQTEALVELTNLRPSQPVDMPELCRRLNAAVRHFRFAEMEQSYPSRRKLLVNVTQASAAVQKIRIALGVKGDISISPLHDCLPPAVLQDLSHAIDILAAQANSSGERKLTEGSNWSELDLSHALLGLSKLEMILATAGVMRREKTVKTVLTNKKDEALNALFSSLADIYRQVLGRNPATASGERRNSPVDGPYFRFVGGVMSHMGVSLSKEAIRSRWRSIKSLT